MVELIKGRKNQTTRSPARRWVYPGIVLPALDELFPTVTESQEGRSPESR
jgi:hypothetical protein